MKNREPTPNSEASTVGRMLFHALKLLVNQPHYTPETAEQFKKTLEVWIGQTQKSMDVLIDTIAKRHQEPENEQTKQEEIVDALISLQNNLDRQPVVRAISDFMELLKLALSALENEGSHTNTPTVFYLLEYDPNATDGLSKMYWNPRDMYRAIQEHSFFWYISSQLPLLQRTYIHAMQSENQVLTGSDLSKYKWTLQQLMTILRRAREEFNANSS